MLWSSIVCFDNYSNPRLKPMYPSLRLDHPFRYFDSILLPHYQRISFPISQNPRSQSLALAETRPIRYPLQLAHWPLSPLSNPLLKVPASSLTKLKNAGLEVDCLASHMTQFSEVLEQMQQLADFIKTAPDETIRRAGWSLSWIRNTPTALPLTSDSASVGVSRRFCH